MVNASQNPPNLIPYPQTLPNPELYGEWHTVTPDTKGAAIGSNVGLQSVHTVLLPSGKILLVSGSSWRNRAPTPAYPDVVPPPNHKGVFIKDELPFLNQNLDTYYSIVNYNGLYDPEENTYYRVPNPLPVPDPSNSSFFLPTDLFCSGQLHLPTEMLCSLVALSITPQIDLAQKPHSCSIGRRRWR